MIEATDKRLQVPVGVPFEFTIRFGFIDRLKILLGFEMVISSDGERETNIGRLVWRLPLRNGFTRIRQ